MRFSCEKSVLFSVFQTAKAAVSPKNPLPILAGIKFEAKGGRVTFTGTDLEMEIRRSVDAEVEESGAAVLPARVVGELLRSLPEGPVVFELTRANSVAVKYGQSKAVINGFDPEEFPEFSLSESEMRFSLEGAVFKDVVKRVSFAANPDDISRPVFTGVFFELDGNKGTAVATDTHRLALLQFPLATGTAEGSFIIPVKALSETAKGVGDQEVETVFTGSAVCFSTGDARFSARLIEGQFPDYRKVIPSKFETKTVLSAEIASVLDRAKLFAGVVKLHVGEASLTVEAVSEIGELREEAPACTEGPPLTVAVDAKYLSEALRAVSGDEIVLEFTGPLSPMLARAVGDDNYLGLVLPVRLPGN